MLTFDILVWLLAAGVAGATAYSGIALIGVFRFLKMRPTPGGGFTPPVSILKPLCGAERELERNLESFFRQDYPDYEILFSVREETDAAVPIVRRLQEAFPSVPMRLLVTGPPAYPNAKVHGLQSLMKAASHDVLVINDSDVRVGPDYLRAVVAPLQEPAVGLVTCISRGVPGGSIWSVLEALGMSVQFVAGVLAAWVVEGLKFSLGPTMVLRKQQVHEIGGWVRLGDYLADDFVLGQRITQAGYRVVLARYIPDHLVCNESLGDSLRHRLRWERSSRRSRPLGYVGQMFMHSLPLALLAWILAPPGNWPVAVLAGICVATRAILALAVGWKLLQDSNVRRYGWLVPVQDLLSFAIWLWAFFGGEIVWRGKRYRVYKGGKLESV